MNDLKDIFKHTQRHLMSGVSRMIPFVVSGGILFAVAVIINGEGAVPTAGVAGALWTIGNSAFSLMVPVLSGYIAFSIADRPGLAPGFAAGVASGAIGAGFLGGIIGGLIAGIVAFYLKKVPFSKNLSSIKTIIFIPTVGVLITSGLMYYVIGTPIASIMTVLTNWLTNLSEGNAVILGIVCGLMTAFDMGGPVNKVSYAFCVATVASGIYTYAGPSAAAVCIPPLGMFLATFIRPKKWTQEERNAGKAALVMGLCGITEGAIPFAAQHPLKIIPALMIGDAVGTAMAFAFGVTCPVAWGGFIVLPTITGKIGWVVSVLVGATIIAIITNLLRKPEDLKVELETSGEVNDDMDLTFE